MKPAVSCIAWDAGDEDLLIPLLKESGIWNVETVPGRIDISDQQAILQSAPLYKKKWDAAGIKLVAMQALLFGSPNLSLFQSDVSRTELLEHLKKVFLAGSQLGVERYVFGSPKNRIKGQLVYKDAIKIAAEFFRLAGAEAEKCKGCLCIEANPSEYGGDFILNTGQAVELVNETSHDGFGLHLDTGGMILAGEDIRQTVREYSSMIKHFHVSVPNLMPLYDFNEVSKIEDGILALKEAEYQGYISLEMKALPQGKSLEERLNHTKQGIESLLDIC